LQLKKDTHTTAFVRKIAESKDVNGGSAWAALCGDDEDRIP